MSNQIKLLPYERFTDKYYQYPGTESIEDMIENIEHLGLNKARCYYIKLNNHFYAVFFDSFDKEIIIGGEKSFILKMVG